MANAKLDIRTEATRPLYASVGVVDRAAELVRGSVVDAQKRIAEAQQNVRHIDLEPAALQAQTTAVVSAGVGALGKEAQARRAAVEARVRRIQDRARALPGRLQAVLEDNEVSYDQLVNRGEVLVSRVRRQESTRTAAKEAGVTSAKAKTTRTQTRNAAGSTARTAKKAARSTASTAGNQAGRPKSSAKATGTAAKKSASAGAKATRQAAKKVGD